MNYEANLKPNMKTEKQVDFLAEYLLTKFNDEMRKYMREEKKTMREINITEMNARENGKRFQQYCWFISQIKSGKTAIIMSPDFVVVDWKTWQRLNKKAEEKQEMFFDEAGEVSDEVWELLEKRLKTTNPPPEGGN